MTPPTTALAVKGIGMVVGLVLILLGVLLWKHPKYHDINDEYANLFSDVGLIVVCVANGAVIWVTNWALIFEAVGYLMAAWFGIRWFAKITREGEDFGAE